jgi:spore coat polysaccharide biosynthesis predicted glycosyltransferase SpsG
MPRPSVLFRADASHAIGYGHVARLCALIEELDPALAPIALFGGDDTLAPWAHIHGVSAEVRPLSHAWTTGELLTAASGVRAVVIDGPALAAALAPALAERGVRTVLIDDRGDCALPAHAVVNHNFHAPSLIAPYPRARLQLLGRRYLLLRRTIRRHPHGACRPRDHARLRVVVTFGGSDPVGATARTLRLLPADHALDLVVIAGPGFRDQAELSLAAAAATRAGHTIELVHAPDDPGALFITADAAICSAGGTLGELAYLGCPAIAFAIVPDQLAPAHAQLHSGLISAGRTWSDTPDHLLRADFSAFFSDANRRDLQRDRALATADAAGPHRVLAESLA